MRARPSRASADEVSANTNTNSFIGIVLAKLLEASVIFHLFQGLDSTYSRVSLEFPNRGKLQISLFPFQYSKLKFDMVLHFNLINLPTMAKIISFKKRVLNPICIKLTRATVFIGIAGKFYPNLINK